MCACVCLCVRLCARARVYAGCVLGGRDGTHADDGDDDDDGGDDDERFHRALLGSSWTHFEAGEGCFEALLQRLQDDAGSESPPKSLL